MANTTADKLQGVINSKAALGQVISSHGGTVPQTFAGYPAALGNTIDAAAQNARLVAFDDINSPTYRGAITFRNSTAIRNYICYGMAYVTSVSAPNATSIGNYAFYGNTSLQSCNFPKVKSLGEGAFYNCRFAAISFPAGLTSIGIRAFQNCTHLTSFESNTLPTIPDSAVSKRPNRERDSSSTALRKHSSTVV
jgi:hypothetical protein